MSGGGGAGPLGQVINQAQNAQQSTSNPYASQGTPVGQQPTRTAQPYSFGSQGFNSPQQQYQPGGGYGMNQSYGNPFGQQMGGYGSPFGGYGSPFGGYGNPFGMMGGNPFQGMNPYAQQGGYGSPFGGAYGINQGNGGMGGFNPYAQRPMRGGFNPYTTDYKPKPVFDTGVDNFTSTFEATPEQMGQPNPFSNTAIQNQQVNGPIAGQPARGARTYENYLAGRNPMLQDMPVSREQWESATAGRPIRPIGGLGGLASMLQGRPMFNKGGKVDE